MAIVGFCFMKYQPSDEYIVPWPSNDIIDLNMYVILDAINHEIIFYWIYIRFNVSQVYICPFSIQSTDTDINALMTSVKKEICDLRHVAICLVFSGLAVCITLWWYNLVRTPSCVFILVSRLCCLCIFVLYSLTPDTALLILPHKKRAMFRNKRWIFYFYKIIIGCVHIYTMWSLNLTNKYFVEILIRTIINLSGQLFGHYTIEHTV